MGSAFLETVLVIEDNFGTCEVLKMILEHAGYRVETFTTGESALDALEHGARPKVVLLDLILEGGMSGYEFRRRQLTMSPEIAAIPVVVCSGVYEPNTQARTMGAAAAFRKPVDPSEVLKAIERAKPH